MERKVVSAPMVGQSFQLRQSPLHDSPQQLVAPISSVRCSESVFPSPVRQTLPMQWAQALAVSDTRCLFLLPLLFHSISTFFSTTYLASLLSLPRRYTSNMAANTKYQAAPQRDSFEEGNYTEAPPSYQAESSSNNPPSSGAFRQEDDHVPDDFKVRNVILVTLALSLKLRLRSEASC